MSHNDEFDQILDDALAEYSQAEPLAGMEERVLQRVRVQAEQRRKLWWRWSAVAAAAVLALVAWLGIREREQQQVVPAPPLAQQPLPPQKTDTLARGGEGAPQPRKPTKAVHATRQAVVATDEVASAAPAPRREQFPTPTPVTPEEHTLMAMAQTHPDALRDLPRNRDDQEIVIAPLTIEPLTKEAAGPQGDH